MYTPHEEPMADEPAQRLLSLGMRSLQQKDSRQEDHATRQKAADRWEAQMEEDSNRRRLGHKASGSGRTLYLAAGGLWL